MTANKPLVAPFPWFGGKSRVAPVVWERFGDVPNYVEPFFGSGAVLLARPHAPGIETVNDADGLVCNFYRALQHAPEEVAEYADSPVNENDLHARHAYLKPLRGELTRRLEGDPEYYDAKIAGWWVWGICCWIGAGWCDEKASGPWCVVDGKLVDLGRGQGVNRQRVHLNSGVGVNRKRVHLADYFRALADRLRRVRVCCGDWERVCGHTPTTANGLTGVFFDPPYSSDAGRDMGCYALDDGNIAHRVRAWCAERGGDPMLRVALCGYAGEGHEELEALGWTCVAWKAAGGYSLQGDGANLNRHRERIWFSPACLNTEQLRLGL